MMTGNQETPLGITGIIAAARVPREMKTSKQMYKAIKNSDRAATLLYEIKIDLDEAANLLEEIKQRQVFCFEPIFKQGELFPHLSDLPEENEILVRLCLNSLVETL
jgi:hypothetical protein